MAKDNAVRRYFVGMVRPCSKCQSEITVTEQMAKSVPQERSPPPPKAGE